MNKSKTNDHALQQFIILNREPHYRMAYSYVKHKEDAYDVLQESIEKALKFYKKSSPTDNLKSWFYKILINIAIDHIRRNSRVTLMEQD